MLPGKIEEPKAHIPFADDTYSPLHDEEEGDDETSDIEGQEQMAEEVTEEVKDA